MPYSSVSRLLSSHSRLGAGVRRAPHQGNPPAVGRGSEEMSEPRRTSIIVAITRRKPWPVSGRRRPAATCGSPPAAGPARPAHPRSARPTGPGMESRLLDPGPHRGLGQVEIPRDLTDRAVTTLTQLDDLSLELRRERPPRPRSLLSHALHDAGHPPGDPRSPDLGCPSKRGRPTLSQTNLESPSAGAAPTSREGDQALTSAFHLGADS